MPLYEYVCPECQERFERLIRSGETSKETTCPACGGGKAARVFSTFATAGQSAAQAGPACGPVG